MGNIVGEEGAIGEELEVAVAVVQEKVNESLVEKGFASLLSLFKVAHIPQIGPAEVPTELPQEPKRGLAEHSPTDFQQ